MTARTEHSVPNDSSTTVPSQGVYLLTKKSSVDPELETVVESLGTLPSGGIFLQIFIGVVTNPDDEEAAATSAGTRDNR